MSQIGNIQWPSRDDLPKLKRPHLNLVHRGAKVGPQIPSEISVYSVDSGPKRDTKWDCFIALFCSLCILKPPGSYLGLFVNHLDKIFSKKKVQKRFKKGLKRSKIGPNT